MLLVLNNRSCVTLFTSGVSIFDWSDYGLSSVKFYPSVRCNILAERSIEIIWKCFFLQSCDERGQTACIYYVLSSVTNEKF